MIKQVCDRCGSETSGFWARMKRTQMITQGEHDLCAKCRDILMDSIRQLEELFLTGRPYGMVGVNAKEGDHE